jgi:hypothetical protein
MIFPIFSYYFIFVTLLLLSLLHLGTYCFSTVIFDRLQKDFPKSYNLLEGLRSKLFGHIYAFIVYSVLAFLCYKYYNFQLSLNQQYLAFSFYLLVFIYDLYICSSRIYRGFVKYTAYKIISSDANTKQQ